MIRAITDFDTVNFPLLDGNVPVLPLTGFPFLNLFGFLECLVLWLISVPVIKFNCQTSQTGLSVS